MNRNPLSPTTFLWLLAASAVANLASAQFAAQVISYDPGATPTPGYTQADAALGAPERLTGEGVFPGVVSPFNPPFLASELVSIGRTGQLTLRLSNYVIPQAAGPEIGVFSNVGVIDEDYPNGTAGSPALAFAVDSAVVELSADGTSWVILGGYDFDVPTNGYTDLADPFAAVPGAAASDPQLPFPGDLNSFSGLKYADAGGPDMLELLAGSAGGKWLDISGTGLTQVGFIRFSIPADLNPQANVNFELDAVSISHAALGAPTVPEPATAVLMFALALVAPVLRRRAR